MLLQIINYLLGKVFPHGRPIKAVGDIFCLASEYSCFATSFLGLLQLFLIHYEKEVSVCASNPLSTQDDVVAALVKGGIRAHAWYGATDEEYHKHIHLVLDFRADFIIDDGCDLVSTIHNDRRELISKVKGGAEETTAGILRLKAMENSGDLMFPLIAVNDAQCKYLFDNRYGTGQSVWDAIMRTTNLVVAGKTICVAGYGWCGKGVALRAKGLGARVIVCEINPVKANEAWMASMLCPC